MVVNATEPLQPADPDPTTAPMVRFALGTFATVTVFSGLVVGWRHLPDDGSEGLAFVLFSTLACVAVVFLWAGSQAWLGLRLKLLLIRWLIVGLVAAVVVEVTSIADMTVTGGAVGVMEDLLFSVPAMLVLVLLPAVTGGYLGAVLRTAQS